MLTWTVAFALAASLSQSAHEDATSSSDVRPPFGVRTGDAVLSTLVAEGSARSATFRHLVETIASTDGIVTLMSGRCPVIGMRGCLLHTIYSAPTARYLWIFVDPRDRPTDTIATIAHELQHAVEVLQRPRIRTAFDMRLLYSSSEAGPPGGTVQRGHLRSYETAAAISIAATVKSELAATREQGLTSKEESR